MKNILKYILCFAFCVGVICATTTTVNAEETEENIICDSVFDVGDTIIYKVSNNYNGYRQDGYAECLATSSNKYICFYLESGVNSPTGYQLAILNNTHFNNLSMTITYVYDNGNTQYSSNNAVSNMRPYDYHIYGSPISGNYFYTNIPIFQSKAEAQEYINGNRDINSAINYKKTMENGSWVRPFENIEINDSDILVPALTNISHQGFSVTNNNDDRYLIQVYVDSGIQDVRDYLSGKTTISNSLYSNSYGLISDNSEANYAGPNINIFDCYGCDNKTELMNDLIDFYSNYPNSWTYEKEFDYDYGVFKSTSPCTFDIWGRYFGKTYAFWNNASKVDISSVDMSSVDEIPIVYTHYRVRYFYYDDDSGFHYGPWSNVVYFSGGRVSQSGIFQDNNGNIIETGADSGLQDQNGNITFNQSNWIDLQDTNSLFGYLRSLINNINATGNNFMTLFGTVFSFLPSDLLAIIWLGIGCIILVGIIRAFS